MQNFSLVHGTGHADRRRCRTDHISACFPFIADARNGTSYAAFRVRSGRTSKDVHFVPMPKTVIRIYHKAVGWNRGGKLAGKHGGIVGSHVLLFFMH